jgi:hypothetical protein
MDHELLKAAALCCLAAACFHPDIDFCAPCTAAGSCPEPATCVEGMCVFDDQRCVARQLDPAPPVADPASHTQAAGGAECRVSDGATQAAPECWDQCCIGEHRYMFPDSVKEGLVLWLDGSGLLARSPGDPLDVWPDRSSGRHDARAPKAPPRVGGNGLQIDDAAQVLAVAHHARHDVGTGDFVLLLAFSLPEPMQYHCLVAKTVPREDGFFVHVDKLGALVLTLYGDCGLPEGCPRLRIGEPSIAADRVQLLGLRRIHGAHLELRLNGEIAAHAQLGLDGSLASHAPLLLGSCGADDSSRLQGSLLAAIMVRATVQDAELAALEAYLMEALAP